MTSPYQFQIDSIIAEITNNIDSIAVDQRVDYIRSVVNTWDMNVGNGTLLLYSGGVGSEVTVTDPVTGEIKIQREYGAKNLAETLSHYSQIVINDPSTKTVFTIEDTGIQDLFNDNIFKSILDDAIASDLNYSDRNREQILNGLDSSGNRVGDGFWDDASEKLVAQHQGDYRLIMPELPSTSVAAMTEIPALLSKNHIPGQKLNGIDLQDWQERFEAEALLHGDVAAHAELNTTIALTSKADLADSLIGKNGGAYYVDTSGHLGKVLGLEAHSIPIGVPATRMSSLEDLELSNTNLLHLAKYGDLLTKAGILGDVLGTSIVVGQTMAALADGNPHKAGEILAEFAGEITGGIAGGAALASIFVATLPFTGVTALTGMIITGAAGLVGSTVGGEVGGAIFKDFYKDVSAIGIVPYLQELADNIEFGSGNGTGLEDFFAGFKTEEQLAKELNVIDIDIILESAGNEWIQDRRLTLPDGTRLLNLKNGDQISVPRDGYYDGVYHITVPIGGVKSSAYTFHDENGSIVPPEGYNPTKISSASSIHWQNNGNGTYTPFTNETISQMRVSTGQRYADAISNGQNISSSSYTQSSGSGFSRIINQEDRHLDNGYIYKTFESFDSNASGQYLEGGKRIKRIEEYSSNGQLLSTSRVTTFTDTAGREHNVIEYQQGPNGNWVVQEQTYDNSGNTYLSPLYFVPSSNLLAGLQSLGATSGSLLADYIADGNVYKNIVYGALLPTIGKHFGTLGAFLAEGNSLEALKEAVFGNQISGTAMAVPEFASTFYKNLASSMGSALGGVIVQELGDTLNLDGVSDEVFNVVAGSITTGISTETFNLIFNNLDSGVYTNLLSSGLHFSKPLPQSITNSFPPELGIQSYGDYVQYQVSNALGAYIGGRLAGEVITPESHVAALFGAAGSAIALGVNIGTQTLASSLTFAFSAAGSFAPIIGTAIGAFIGQVLGTALGNVFGGNPSIPGAWARIVYDEADREYQTNISWDNNGGNVSVAQSMASQVALGVNEIIAKTNGILRQSSIASDMQIGYRGDEFTVSFAGGEERVFSTHVDAITYAAFKLMKDFDLVGGHAILMRAWHNSDAENIFELKEDILVAEAFQLYLTNPAGVIALMMNDSSSEVAKGWAKVLQRAAELELHIPNEKDLDGGWGEVLKAQGVNPEWIPSISGEKIILTDPVSGQNTTIQHAIGPGYEIVRILGTDGNDIIHVNVDGPSIVYVDASAGNDQVLGSESSDIILGGAGDDEINGLGGNDWLHGGSGNDHIDGGAGSDLIIGSDDDDNLIGSDGDDTIYGNDGNDTIQSLGGGNDILFGGEGNDYLLGNGYSVFFNPSGVTNTKLIGGPGDDILYGFNHNELIGDSGNDIFRTLEWGYGNRFVVGRGNGHDIIEATFREYNTLRFDDSISVNELYFLRNQNDLKILVLGEDQSVTVKNFYGSNPPKIKIESHNGRMELSDRDKILQAVQNDTTLPTPTGQYNLISDPLIALATNDFEGPAIWTYNYYNFNFGNDTSETLNSDLFYISLGSAGNDLLKSNRVNGAQMFFGDSGDDVIYGYELEDRLVGGIGNDQLFGGEDKDVLYGGHGNDFLDGGNGNDSLDGGAGDDTLSGGAGDDNSNGGDGNDVINDIAGNNIIWGGAGNDEIISLGDGNNTIYGGSGNDTISTLSGIDTIYGEDGDDTISSGAGSDNVFGGNGNDTLIYTLSSSSAQDRVIYNGGQGLDKIIFNLSAQLFSDGILQRDFLNLRKFILDQRSTDPFTFTTFALSLVSIESLEIKVDGVINNLSYQSMIGTDLSDVINGSANHDYIIGNKGADTINSGLGHDYIEGGEGDDVIDGGIGHDDIYGGHDNDLLHGGEGNDFIYGDDGDDTIQGNEGNDTLYGGSGEDYISGDLGDDVIYGGIGDDELVSSDGNDRIYGEGGNDFMNGGQGNDILDGGSGDDILKGGKGSDNLFGGIGTDILEGEEGPDILLGGTGSDTFIFGISSIGALDLIKDFSLTDGDKLDVSNLLIGYNQSIHNIEHFVQITTSGSNSIVSVDSDGGGNNFIPIATLSDVIGLTDETALKNSGNIIAHRPSGPTLIANESFQTGAAGWSDNRIDNTSTVFGSFLGRFAGGTLVGQDVSKTFALSGQQSQVTIEFDFYKIDSWDWENFEIYLNDVNVLAHPFNNNTPGAGTGTFAGGTWERTITNSGDLGFSNGEWSNDAIVHYKLVLNTTGTSLKLGFGSSLNGTWLPDESYGIDNLLIVSNASSANAAPVAVDDVSQTNANTAVSINVLSNDTDANNDVLDVSAVTQGTNGTVVINPNKTLTYTPNAGYTGSDSFTYTVSDGKGGTDTGVVSLTVNTATSTTIANENFQTGAAGWSDNRIDNTSTVFGSYLGRFTGGGATQDTFKTFNFSGTQSQITMDFDMYRLDSWDNEAFEIYINDVKVVDNIFGNSNPGAATGTFAGGTWERTVTSYGDLGYTNWDPNWNDGIFHYRLTLNSTATSVKLGFGSSLDSANINDESWGVDNLLIVSNASSANAAPVAVDDVSQTNANTAVSINVLSNDTDANNDVLDVSAITQGTNGTVVINPNKTITYTPNAGYAGSDSFTYTVSDGKGGTDIGAVSLTVNTVPVSGPTLIANENFQTGAAGWSDNRIDNTSTVFGSFLGRFAGGTLVGQDVSKTFALSGQQSQVTIEFDFYKIDSWDWENFEIYLNDVNVLAHPFNNNTPGAGTGTFAGGTWERTITNSGDLGFSNGEWSNDAIVHYKLVLNTTGTSLKLGFGSSLNGTWLPDESYGVDNILIVDNAIMGDAAANTLNGTANTDVLRGNGGNDTLYGNAGNDLLYGDSGLDTLFGGLGSDIFVFNNSSAFANIDVISDFKTSELDKINVKDLLQGYDPVTSAITDFVQITTSGANSILRVDADGGANNFVQIATLNNITGLTDEAALVTNGTLIVS